MVEEEVQGRGNTRTLISLALLSSLELLSELLFGLGVFLEFALMLEAAMWRRG
jgi:hypothetical protein